MPTTAKMKKSRQSSAVMLPSAGSVRNSVANSSRIVLMRFMRRISRPTRSMRIICEHQKKRRAK